MRPWPIPLERTRPRESSATPPAPVSRHIAWGARSVPAAVLGGCLWLLSPCPSGLAKKVSGPPPAISHILPCGGKAGSTFPCTIGGSLANTENKVWTDAPGITFKPTAKPEVFEVSIDAKTHPGPHLVRFYNNEGAAPPHVFVVGTHDEADDVEPNDDHHHPQQLAKIPVTVNGVLEKSGSADTFAFEAQAGRWIVLDLQGYALGSQMDPAMRLLDGQGTEIALSHDSFNLDPFIAWEVKKSGVYLVQVMAFSHPPAADVTLKGGPSHVYRLTITDGAHARAAWPPVLQRPGPGRISLLGWNLDSAAGIDGIETGATPAGEAPLRAPTPNGETVLLQPSDLPVTLEAEPNDDTAHATRISLPCAIGGRIGAPGDEDRFVFAARKGDKLEFRLRARALHSPLDAWLRIEDASGKILQTSDDARDGETDASLKWKVPADGDCFLALGDLFHHGGRDHVYAIEAGPAQPRVEATLAGNALRIDEGKSAELKCTVKISGEFKGKLRARVEPLPPGVSAAEAEVPGKGGEVKLKLTAAAGSAPVNQPVEVLIVTAEPDAPRMWKATFDLRGVEPRGDRLVNEDSRLWLTVAQKADEAATAAKASEKKP